MSLFLLLTTTVSAATWTVRSDGTGNFTSVPAAVSAAASGDRIEVSAGTWAGPVDFSGKDLELVGVDGATETILTGSGAAAVLVFDGGESHLARVEGFTLQDGTRAVWIDGASPTLVDLHISGFGSATVSGGAVWASGRPTFEDVVFTENIGLYGGAVYIDSGLVTFRRCTFTGNGDPDYTASATWGGAIYGQYADIDLEDSLFEGNLGHYGAHVALWNGGKLEVRGGSFVDGVANYGGVVSYGTVWTDISDARFEGNAAYYQGGGLYAYDADRVTVDATTFTDNSVYTSGGGGGIYTNTPGDLSITSSTFIDNVATYTYGAAVYTIYPTALTITDSVFEGQQAYASGGAVYGYILYGPTRIENTRFTDNTAQYYPGGALHLDYGTHTVTLQGLTFDRNVSGTHGGALYVNDLVADLADLTFTDNQAGQSGGGARIDNSRSTRKAVTLRRIDAADNTAGGDGGGLSVGRLPGAVVEDFRVVSNRAGGAGGGLHLDDLGAVSATRVWAAGNQAVYGGGLYLAEVGVVPPDSSDPVLALHNLLLQQNDARYGGGLCVVEGVDATLRQATFVGNSATESGAALCLYDQSLDVQNSAFAWNTGAPTFETLDDATDRISGIYNAWYANTANVGGTLPDDTFPQATDITAPPEFAHSHLDGDFSDDAWTLASTSPLIDAGNPATLDPDGSAADIGARGGPSTWNGDADGDGVDAWQDCDDHDATVQPGASDTWYDGVDSNCDGADDFDADADGFALGDDCDDHDATVAEDCGDDTPTDTADPEPEPDDTASDTPDAPVDGTTSSPDKGGCSVASGAVGLTWVAGLCAVASRRRFRVCATP